MAFMSHSSLLLKALICVALLAQIDSSIIRTERTMNEILGIDPVEMLTCEEKSKMKREKDTEGSDKEKTQYNGSCSDCADRKAALSTKELQELRYAFVKDQILQKLQLTQRPCPHYPKPNLQPLLMAADDMKNITEDTNRRDDQNSKIESLVLFQTNEDYACSEGEKKPCMQMQFSLPKGIKKESLTSLEIWIYKANEMSILEIKEIVFDEFGKIRGRRPVSRENEEINSGWIKYLIPSSISWRNENSDFTFTIEVTCEYFCNKEDVWPIEIEGEKKPFIIAHVRNYKAAPRSRRSVDCVEGSTTCCRETFYISFADIGWDDWILHPEGYNANFCRGKCMNDISITRFHHSTVLHSYMQSNSETAKDMGIKMCCTPSQMSSVSFFYRDGDGNIFFNNLPNMVVETCDCA